MACDDYECIGWAFNEICEEHTHRMREIYTEWQDNLGANFIAASMAALWVREIEKPLLGEDTMERAWHIAASYLGIPLAAGGR